MRPSCTMMNHGVEPASTPPVPVFGSRIVPTGPVPAPPGPPPGPPPVVGPVDVGAPPPGASVAAAAVGLPGVPVGVGVRVNAGGMVGVLVGQSTPTHGVAVNVGVALGPRVNVAVCASV